jgi:hypothetical protein
MLHNKSKRWRKRDINLEDHYLNFFKKQQYSDLQNLYTKIVPNCFCCVLLSCLCCSTVSTPSLVRPRSLKSKSTTRSETSRNQQVLLSIYTSNPLGLRSWTSLLEFLLGIPSWTSTTPGFLWHRFFSLLYFLTNTSLHTAQLITTSMTLFQSPRRIFFLDLLLGVGENHAFVGFSE